MIGRKSFLVYFNQIFGAVTGLIGMFFIARFMTNPAYNYGMITFALSFAGLFSFMGSIFNSAHVKRISEGRDEGTCMGTFITLKTISLTVMLASAYGGILIWKHVMGRGFQSPAHESVLYIILILAAIKTMTSIGTNTFQGKGEIAKMEIVKFMDHNVPFVFIILVSLTGGQAVQLAYAYFTGGLLMALAAIHFLKPIPIKKPDWGLARSYWQFGLPSLFISISSLLGKKVDVVMVQLFWSSVNVGYYGVSLRFSALLIGISSAVVTIAFPTISGHHARSDWESIRKLITNSSRYLSMVVIPVISFIVIFPEQTIIILLSRDFIPAVPVVRIMAINAFFLVITGPNRTVFSGINMPGLGAKLVILSNVINFALNVLLIPSSIFGVPFMGLKEVGAALATLTASVILFFLTIHYSKKVAGTTLYPKITIHILSGLITSAVFFFIENNLIQITRYYHLGIFSMAFLGFYTLVLYLLGEFTKKDWDFIWSSIHPGEMLGYVKDEVGKN